MTQDDTVTAMDSGTSRGPKRQSQQAPNQMRLHIYVYIYRTFMQEL